MHKSVLIIDDEYGISSALSVRLQALGYSVHTAPNGRAGIAEAIRRTPNLILLDIRLPDIDGFEVCRRLKASEILASIPVIFLSANVKDIAKRQAMETGGVAFLSKPYEAKDVVAAIASTLADPLNA